MKKFFVDLGELNFEATRAIYDGLREESLGSVASSEDGVDVFVSNDMSKVNNWKRGNDGWAIFISGNPIAFAPVYPRTFVVNPVGMFPALRALGWYLKDPDVIESAPKADVPVEGPADYYVDWQTILEGPRWGIRLTSKPTKVISVIAGVLVVVTEEESLALKLIQRAIETSPAVV